MSRSLIFDEHSPKHEMKPNKSHLFTEKDSLTQWTSSLTSKRFLEGQDKVYEYQQKPYDILNFNPKKEPSGHRIYPRFSLEHKVPSGKTTVA